MSNGDPQQKGWPTWVIVLVAAAMLLIVAVGVMAVLAVFGMRRFLVNAKTAEARNVVGQIARDAKLAYEIERVGGRGKRLCGSALPVPSSPSSIGKGKYLSSPSDWSGDKDNGWVCLKFTMDAPQYYQYLYEATATGFTVTAHGDLNGNGALSTFVMRGRVSGDQVVLDRSIEETNPEE
ncbi:MAG: hypothetical protein WCI05_00775 [Myxococcales bacterium]